MSVGSVPVVVLGLGGVGRALLRQIVAARRTHAARWGVSLDVVAVADSGAAWVAPQRRGARHAVPLHDGALLAVVEAKAAGRGIGDVEGWRGEEDGLGGAAEVAGRRRGEDEVWQGGEAPERGGDPWAWRGLDLPHAIVVDVTASEATTAPLRAALERGWDAVLANKLPLAGAHDDYHFLTGGGVDAGAPVVPRRHGRARWEATVGAGVPLIATLMRLVAADDGVARIEGTFSGTLNFVATELRAGRPLSDIVADAMARGFTEPDPRTDLGGHDMARKALILARMLGWRLDLADVAVEGLYPPEWDDPAHPDHAGAVAAFLQRLPSLDAPTAARAAAAAAEGGVYRLTATVAAGRAAVTPAVVPADSPLGRLTGTDNLVAFHTRWYDPAPLVLQGRGAGVEATASGVLSDVVELAMGRQR